MRIRVVIEFDPQTNSFSAHCPELPGCTSAGETEEDALANVREAIDLYLEPSGDVSDGARVIEVVV
ncbi:MAG: type II toxin-antitoxin system HicB family antitoxin [Planctomycetota bacterium]|jgi:predicted RNase H-like HicB family nuclease